MTLQQCRHSRWVIPAAAAWVMTACSSHVARTGIPECFNGPSAICNSARDRLQRERYAELSVAKLIAASDRALGDLNFDVTERDDAHGRVMGRYVADAPTHDGQLDREFGRIVQKHRLPTAMAATVMILPAATGASGTEVQLRLTAPTSYSGNDPSDLIDDAALYQMFFQQLGIELGAPPVPWVDDTKQDRDTAAKRRKETGKGVTPSVPPF